MTSGKAAFTLISILWILSGCASAPVGGTRNDADVPRSRDPKTRSADGIPVLSGGTLTEAYVRNGIQLLRAGNFEGASQEFNRTLRHDPQNSYLQFLNGFAYHLIAEHSNPDQYEFARIGYELALKFDPNNWLAAQQLARLCLSTRDYQRAQEYFATALLYRPNDPSLLYGLAQSSYYLTDMETALGAVRKAAELMPGSPEIVSGHALISAAAGQPETAQLKLAAFRQMKTGALHVAKLEERIEDWNNAYTQSAGAPSTVPNAQAEAAANRRPPSFPDSSEGILAQHRMVIIDVVMLRTEENETSNKGVNLLQNLSLTFSGEYAQSQSRPPDADAWTSSSRIFNSRINLPEVRYSMDIFNAGDDRTEVLALPTLIALDGKPSTSFAGLTLNVAVKGVQTASITALDAGITLEVLPTFLSDNTIQLHVLARRTFVENGAVGSFQEAVRTSKNEVMADVVMEMGKTLVLSGLREKQTMAVKSGVPLLRDIPLIQYLFSHEETFDFHKSALVILTPRRPAPGVYRTSSGGEDPNAGESPSDQVRLNEFRKRYGYIFDLEPNITRIMRHMDRHELAMGLRSADFFDRPWWGTSDSIDFILRRAASFLYY